MVSSSKDDVTVLVTGGAGFIGSWVLRELVQQGLRPLVYDLQPHAERWQKILGADASKLAFVPGDLTDRERLWAACDQASVSYMIHLGALLTPACHSDPWLGCQVNVLGSVAVFEYARQRAGQIRGLSYASSLAVYGPEPDDSLHPSLDTDSTHTASFYGAFKRSVELIAQQYWQHFQIASFGLRPHVVYGPERTVGLTAGPSLAAKAAALGERFQINYSGPAGYDYVEDVARAFVRSALTTPPGANVADLPSQPATTGDIVAALEQMVPRCRGQISVTGGPIPANTPTQLQPISKWFPDWQATPWFEGLRRTVAFYS